MKKILEEFGDKWEIALEVDGEFEYVQAKEHPFFKQLKKELLSSQNKTSTEDKT